LQEFFAALISFFLIGPLQAEIKERVGAVPRDAVAEVSACVREATPALIRQGSEDPWRVAGHVFEYWVGMTSPEDILAETTPRCRRAAEILRRSPEGSERATEEL
jgi:hypothetical protein